MYLNERVVRVRISGLTCPSQERLLYLRLHEVTGVEAAAICEGDVLTVFIDPATVDIDRLIAGVVDAGLVPEELLEAPALSKNGESHVA